LETELKRTGVEYGKIKREIFKKCWDRVTGRDLPGPYALKSAFGERIRNREGGYRKNLPVEESEGTITLVIPRGGSEGKGEGTTETYLRHSK